MPELRPVIVAAWGPPALAFIRSLSRRGATVGLLCIRGRDDPLPHSRYLSAWATLPPECLGKPSGIEVTWAFLKEFRATGVLCIEERLACWVQENRHELPRSASIWLPKVSTIRNVLSKAKQIEAAAEVGFDVLPTYFLGAQDLGACRVPWNHFPLCLRPSAPGAVEPWFKVRLISSKEELANFGSTLTRLDVPLIAQPFRNLPNLVVHGARSSEGHALGLVAFLAERKFQGLTLCIRRIALAQNLAEKCIAFADLMGIVGNYHFDLMYDREEKKTWFLEINNRFGGTTAKVLACGYDEPALALEAYGVRCGSELAEKHRTVSSKQALLKYMYYALTDRLTPLDYPDEPKAKRVAKALWGLLFWKDDVWDWRDLRGSLAMYGGNILAKARKLVG